MSIYHRSRRFQTKLARSITRIEDHLHASGNKPCVLMMKGEMRQARMAAKSRRGK